MNQLTYDQLDRDVGVCCSACGTEYPLHELDWIGGTCVAVCEECKRIHKCVSDHLDLSRRRDSETTRLE